MTGDGEWTTDPLYQTIPPFAGPGEPRIEIGGNIPPELVAFYTPLLGGPVIGGTFSYKADGSFVYQALLNDGSMVFGAWDPSSPPLAEAFRVANSVTPASLTTFGFAGESHITMANPDGEMNVGAHRVTAATNTENFSTLTAGTYSAFPYADLPGSPSCTITKAYADTLLEITMGGTWFASGAMAAVDFAVSVTGVVGDTFVSTLKLSNSALGAHTPHFGQAKVASAPAGVVTAVARWRRTAGAGVLNVGLDDFLSLTVREVTP